MVTISSKKQPLTTTWELGNKKHNDNKFLYYIFIQSIFTQIKIARRDEYEFQFMIGKKIQIIKIYFSSWICKQKKIWEQQQQHAIHSRKIY